MDAPTFSPLSQNIKKKSDRQIHVRANRNAPFIFLFFFGGGEGHKNHEIELTVNS